MIAIIVIISLIFVAVTLHNWRYGLVLFIVIGIFQDPMRKLAPGQPVYYTLWAGGCFMFVTLVAFLQREIGEFKELFLYDRKLRRIWIIYLAAVGLQVLHGILRWQSIPSTMLGTFIYIGPVIALLVSIGYAASEKHILRVIRVYLVFAIPVVATVYLSEAYSEDWKVLREIGSFVGQELIIYDVGRALKSYSGLFRVGEITAWHAATCCMFLTLLLTRNESLTKRLFFGSLIVLLIGAIVLTGRRKMLMTLSIYIILHWSLVSYFMNSAFKQAVTIVTIGSIGLFALSNLEEASTTSIYLERGKTVFEDSGSRINISYQLSKSAIDLSSGLGFGVGVSVQGGQYISGSGSRPSTRGLGEVGLGKIILELGVPGLIFLSYLILLIGHRLILNFRLLAMVDRRLLVYSISFSSFLCANAITFLVATQIYGDPYILIILGIVGGILFSVNARGIRMYFDNRLASQVPEPT